MCDALVFFHFSIFMIRLKPMFLIFVVLFSQIYYVESQQCRSNSRSRYTFRCRDVGDCDRCLQSFSCLLNPISGNFFVSDCIMCGGKCEAPTLCTKTKSNSCPEYVFFPFFFLVFNSFDFFYFNL